MAKMLLSNPLKMSRKLLGWMFNRDQVAEALYARVVAHSRSPVFFRNGGVADTVDGRFDILALHVYLLLRRLQAGQENDLSQQIFDLFFANLDTGLREMGVGDLTVGKRIRGMAEAFYGRAKAYDLALKSRSPQDMRDALQRNLFRGLDVSGTIVNRMADYVLEQDAYLNHQPLDAITSGEIAFKSYSAVA